jgi:hypothetical protein
LKETAAKQKSLYEKLFEAHKNNLPEKAQKINAAIQETHTLLDAHKGDIYDVTADGLVSFIGSSGQWQTEHFPGMRPLDDDDKKRLLKMVEQYEEFPERLDQDREEYAQQSFVFRMEVTPELGGVPITAVLAPSLLAEKKRWRKESSTAKLLKKAHTSQRAARGRGSAWTETQC